MGGLYGERSFSLCATHPLEQLGCISGDFHPSICLISYSLIPAAAIAVAPPMHSNEWDETRRGLRYAIFIAAFVLLIYCELAIKSMATPPFWRNS